MFILDVNLFVLVKKIPVMEREFVLALIKKVVLFVILMFSTYQNILLW